MRKQNTQQYCGCTPKLYLLLARHQPHLTSAALVPAAPSFQMPAAQQATCGATHIPCSQCGHPLWAPRRKRRQAVRQSKDSPGCAKVKAREQGARGDPLGKCEGLHRQPARSLQGLPGRPGGGPLPRLELGPAPIHVAFPGTVTSVPGQQTGLAVTPSCCFLLRMLSQTSQPTLPLPPAGSQLRS